MKPADSSELRRAAITLPSLPLPGGSGYALILPPPVDALAAKLVGCDVVHTHSLFVSGALARGVASRLGVPLVLSYHTNLEAYAHYAPGGAAIARRLLREHTRRFAKHADLICVPTAVTADALRAIGVRAPIAVVPGGIDTARFTQSFDRIAVRRELGLPSEARLLLCVARLGVEKNLEILLDMLAGLDRGIMLVLVGTGTLRDKLRRLARRRRVEDRLYLLGAIPPDQVHRAYGACDLFVFPSHSETQGLVLAEAAAAGLPIVAVDGPVTREVLRGCDARLTPDEPSALADAVRDSLADDDAIRHQARSHFARRFDAAQTTGRLIETYRALLAR